MLKLAARARNIKEAEACLSLGFRLLEITLPCPGGPEEHRLFKELADKSGAAYLGHGPEEGNPRDLVHLEREYLPALEQAVLAAQDLGSHLLTVHSWLEPRWLDQKVIEEKIKLLLRVASRGAESGVKVCLENLSESWLDLSHALAAAPELGLTLDVGHAQLLQPENEAASIIAHLFDRIYHLHLHDNRGGNSPRDDLHLPPGRGKVPFDRIFRRLKEKGYDRTATLELHPPEMAEARDWVTAAWERA